MALLHCARSCATFASCVFALAFVLGPVSQGHASEIVVQSFQGPLSSTPFYPSADMRMASRITPPVDGQLVGVQILWGSVDGTAAPSQQAAIHISSARESGPGNFFEPETTLATINSPVLVDGGANEFRFLDPGTNLVPLSVPVTAGIPFYIDLEMGDTPSQAPGPGMLIAVGANALSNWVMTPPDPDWVDATLLVGAPNFAMRAIIEPVPEPSGLTLAGFGVVGLSTLVWRRRRMAQAGS